MTGILPSDLVYDPFDGAIVEDAIPQNGLYEYDATSGALVSTIPLPSNAEPGPFAIDPVNNWAYVADPSQSQVIVANLSNGLFGLVNTRADASAVGYDPLADDILVANSANDNVTVIAASNHSVVGSVPVGGDPDSIGFDPVAGEMYVSNAGTDNITLLNATTLAAAGSVPVGTAPGPSFYDSITGSMLVVNRGSANLSVVNATTGASRPGTPFGAAPESVTFDAATDGIAVGDADLDTVATYNATTGALQARAQLNSSPFALATDPSGSRIFVIQQVPNLLTVLNGTNLAAEATSSLPYQPSEVLYLAATGDLAITSSDDSQVAILDPSNGATLGNLSVPDPAGLVEDPAVSTIFVGTGTPAVVAISETNVTATASLSLPSQPTSLSYDPVDGLLYFSMPGAGIEFASPSPLTFEGGFGSGNFEWLLTDPVSGVLFGASVNADLSTTVLAYLPTSSRASSRTTRSAGMPTASWASTRPPATSSFRTRSTER